MTEDLKRGTLMNEITELREMQKHYMELLKWFSEHSDEVIEIENRGLRN